MNRPNLTDDDAKLNQEVRLADVKKQAVKEFAEQIKENYCNLDYLPSGDEFCEFVDELIKKYCNEG